MFRSLVIALSLLCFLWQSRFVQCRSTGALSEFNNEAHLEGRCLKWCLQETSSRQTCLEKCLLREEKAVIHDKNSSISGNTVLNPLSIIRRKRSLIGDDPSSLCPTNVSDTVKNNFATVTTAERKQYENSDRWYVKITWDPINEGLVNYTGYAFIFWYEDINTPSWKYIKRQKNENYVVFNESVSGWSYWKSFFFNVIARPCLTESVKFDDLDDYSLPSSTDLLDDYIKQHPFVYYYNCINGSTLMHTDLPKDESRDYDCINTRLPCQPRSNEIVKGDYSHVNRHRNCLEQSHLPTPPPAATVFPTKGTTKIAVLASTVSTGSFVVIVAIAFLLRRKYSQSRKKISKKIPSAGFKYDAFIIFNQKDQAWVESNLLQLLEKKHGFRCCVHYRDFEPGKTLVDNMSNSVHVSRKVIAVASKNFFESNFCNYELEQAIYKQARENDNSIIVIRKDDVSNDRLPEALKERSYIDYSNKLERKTWVSKLIKALESNRSEDTLSSTDESNRPLLV